MSEADYIKCRCLHCGQQIEFPASGIGETVECPQCSHQTMLHRAVARATAPSTVEASQQRAKGRTAPGIRLTRQTVVAVITVACFLGAAAWGFGNWREREIVRQEHEAEAEKSRTALAAELRLLDANLNTGINQRDFLGQAARVRAAYDAAETNLSTNQNYWFGQIDDDMTGIAFFLDSEATGTLVPGAPSYYSLQAERMAAKLKIDPHRETQVPTGYYPADCVQDVIGKAGKAIHSFLNDSLKD